MRKKFECILILLCFCCLCTAQQVVSSGGYSLKSGLAVNWVLGGHLPGGIIVKVDDQNEQLMMAPSSFKVYPLPASDFINIEIPTVDESQLVFELYSSSGEKVLYREVFYQPVIKIDIKDLSSGVYFLKAFSKADKNLLGVERIIKNKN